MSEASDTAGTGEAATRIVVSYPASLSERTRARVGQAYYRKYLLRTHERAAVGDVWEEFTDVGCCGSQIHIPFRVEEIEGGPALSTETELEYTARPEGDIEGGWSVQNEID
jgi:hypothetical protein